MTSPFAEHSPRPSQTLQRFYAAEERYIASGGRDFAALADTVDAGILVVVPESLPYGGRWCGHEGLRRFMDAFADAWSELAIADVEVLEAQGDVAVVILTMRARARHTGRTMSMPLCQVNRFDRGRLCEVRPFYGDTHVVNHTLGHRAAG